MIAAKEDFAKSFLAQLSYTIENSQEEHIPSKTFKPSSLRCMRAAVMQVLGLQVDDTKQSETSIGVTSAGTFIHQDIQRYCTLMKSCGYVNVGDYVREKKLPLIIRREANFENGEYETKLYSREYNISFLCDGIIKHEDDYYILEIKSINSQGMYKLDGVPEKYKTQATAYSQLLSIPKVLFLFVNRDLFNKKTFLFSPTREEIRNFWENIKYGNDCVKNNIIPPMPKESGNKFCQYCEYRKTCGEMK